MTYSRRTWVDAPSTATPVNAAALNNIEDGVEEALAADATSVAFYATDYGVVADGSTNDVTAMQAAIDAVSAAGGGLLILPPGSIRFSTYPSPFPVIGLTTGYGCSVQLKSHVHIRGIPGKTKILAAAISGTDGSAAFGSQYASDWSIEHVVFDGSYRAGDGSSEGAHSAVTVGPATDWRVQFCEVFGFLGKGIQSIGEQGTSVLKPSRFKIVDNYIHENRGNAVGYDRGATDVEIARNYITTCLNTDAESLIGENLLRAKIVDNTILDWGHAQLNDSSQVLFRGNKINALPSNTQPVVTCTGAMTDYQIIDNDIDLTTSTTTQAGVVLNATGTCARIFIQGNNIRRSTVASASPAINMQSDDATQKLSDVTVSDNVITGGTSGQNHAIVLKNTARPVVTGNKVYGSSSDCIYMQGSCTDAVVTGNGFHNGSSVFEATRGAITGNSFDCATGNVGVQGSASLVFSGNVVKGGANPIIQIANGDHVVVGNLVIATHNNAQWIGEANTYSGYFIADNKIVGTGTISANITTPGSDILRGNAGWPTEGGGVASVANAGTISHGLKVTPTKVTLLPGVAGRQVAVTAISSSTITISLTDSAGSAVGSAENVYWTAAA